MANRRKKSARNTSANQRNGNGSTNSDSKTVSREPSLSVSNDGSNLSSRLPVVKDPPLIIRRQTKQRFPVFTAQKFLWWASLAIMIGSCLIGVGRSRIRKSSGSLEQEEQQENETLRSLDDKNNALKQQEKKPSAMRFLKGVKTNLVQGLQASTFTSIASEFAARGSSSPSIKTSTKNSDNSMDIIDNEKVVASVETESTSRDTTDTSNNSHESDPRIQQVKKELKAEYSNAFTAEPHLTDQQRSLLQELSNNVQQEWPDMHQRAVQVAWGGPPPDLDLTTDTNDGTYHWWNPPIPYPHDDVQQDDSLDQIDGGYLLYSYLSIMKWPETLHTHFPFGLCKGEGCPSATAIGHSLEWREKYQPWMATKSVLEENKDGWIYARGFSPPSQTDPDYGQHSVIWVRPGPVIDSAAYFRCIMHAVDRATAMSLQQSSGRVGKFNVMVDGRNYEWSCVPALKYIKQAVIMLQDHFPDRLGMVWLVNVSLAGEILLRLVKQLLTKEVRDKLKILSSDPDRRKAQLETLSEKEYIPDWLGGTDTYRFDADAYYPKSMQWSEEQGLEFMESMPYHSYK
jgi:hypothetical protein